MTGRNLLLFGLVLLGALALKEHYRRADAGQLDWILAPTTVAVEAVSGASFEREAGTGYLCREDRFVIAKACAGVNFLIVAFAASAIAFAPRARRLRDQLLVVAGCAGGAYLAAIVANTVRIAIALELHRSYEPGGWLTRERVHRLEGTVVYVVFLCGFYLLAQRLARRPSPLARPTREVTP